MDTCHKILLAINDSDDAMRAVKYVSCIYNMLNSPSIYLFHVFPDPPPDYYKMGGSIEAYKEVMIDQGKNSLSQAKNTLTKCGVGEERINLDIQLANGRTISEAILEARQKCDCQTLVVGKRGISKSEEFLFGSISNTLARNCRGFTTLIVG